MWFMIIQASWWCLALGGDVRIIPSIVREARAASFEVLTIHWLDFFCSRSFSAYKICDTRNSLRWKMLNSALLLQPEMNLAYLSSNVIGVS